MMYNYPFPNFPGFRKPYQYNMNNFSQGLYTHNSNINHAQNPYNAYSPSSCVPANTTYIKNTNNPNYINHHKNINHHSSNYINMNNKNNCNSNSNSNGNSNCNSSSNLAICNDVTSNCTSDDENVDYFDFFGIRLAFDDLLIIALLFFLYKEDTKDPYVYISLILLLLS